jgi:integrase
VSKRRGQGEGSIYQRSQDGRWVGTVNLGWQGGRRVRKSFYGQTRREVQEKLSKALRAAESGQRIDQDRLTVGAFLTDWLDAIKLLTAT